MTNPAPPPIEALPDIVYLVDLENRRNLFVNQAVQSALQYSAEEVARLGSDLFPTLIHPEDLPAVGAHYATLEDLEDGGSRAIEYRIRRKDGTYRWYRSTDSVFEKKADGSPKVILGTAIDITPLIERERAIRLLNRELAHRVQNLFSVTLSLVRQARRDNADPVLTLKMLERRLMTLGAMHGRVRDSEDAESTTLDDLIEGFMDGTGARDVFVLDLIPAAIPARLVTPISMFLYEIISRETPESVWPSRLTRVHLSSRMAEHILELEWLEPDTPEGAVDHMGTDSHNLLDYVADSIDGSVEMTQAGSDLKITLRFPLERAAPALVS